MKPDAELDELHNKARALFPEGLTVKNYMILTLESADSEGEIYTGLVDFWTKHGILLKMSIDGLIKRKHYRMDEPMEPFLITEKGREWLSGERETQE